MQKILDNIDEAGKGGLEKAKAKSEEVVCPFCGDGEFDLVGLKEHLLYGGMFSGSCSVFRETPQP